MRSRTNTLIWTAFIVQWCAIGAAVATVFSIRLLPDGNASTIVAGYLGCIALALVVWSLALSFRARHASDVSGWWRVVFLAALLELNLVAIGTWLWAHNEPLHPSIVDRVVDIGLPIFLPFFSLVIPAAVVIAKLLVKRSSAELSDAAKPTLLKRYTRRTILACTAVLLPLPLFVYCACSPTDDPYWIFQGQQSRSTWGWRAVVANYSPDFIRDGALDCLARLPDAVGREWTYKILATGRCSRMKLLEHLYFPTHNEINNIISDRDLAFSGFIQAYPESALELAQDFRRGTAGRAWTYSLSGRAGRYLADAGSVPQIRNAIDNSTDCFFLTGLFDRLKEKERIEFAPDLANFVRLTFTDDKLVEYTYGLHPAFVDQQLICSAVSAQSTWSEPAEFIAQWTDLLCDPARRKLRDQHLRLLSEIHGLRTRLTTIMNAWERSDLDSKRLLLSEYVTTDLDSDKLSADDTRALAEWMNFLVKQSDHYDLAVRRAATFQLDQSAGKIAYGSHTRIIFGDYRERVEKWSAPDNREETRIELAERGALSAAAKTWIDAHTSALAETP